ncbi:hypothetical protein NL676_039003 [Syzygium grande]|nr:hypothetical protein NL676_039003 [Syzygium grande]
MQQTLTQKASAGMVVTFPKPVAMRKARRWPHRSSHVRHKHGHLAILRHFAFARHRQSQQQRPMLGPGGLSAAFFQGGEEIPSKDEITPSGDDRFAWGVVLGLICFLTLFPNVGGMFSSPFFESLLFRSEF